MKGIGNQLLWSVVERGVEIKINTEKDILFCW